MSTTTTTAEIAQGLRLTGGPVWTLTIEQDRKPLARGGLGKGQRSASLVGDSLIHLLRTAALLMEQEGIEDLDDLAVALRQT